MVEATVSNETREQIRARIKQRFVQTFNTMDQHEIKITEEDGNVEVRQSWDETTNVMMAFGEQKVVQGLMPDDFLRFFETWETVGAEANSSIDSIEKVGTDEGVDTMKVIANAPWPLSNRVMFSTRYLELNQDGGHMALFAAAGNERYINDPAIFTEKERKDLVLAVAHLTGWWVKPVKDESGTVTGSHMLYFSQVDAGGNIPTFVQNSQGPKTALNSIKGAVAWAKKNKQ